MIVRTVVFLAFVKLLARINLVVLGVILLLLPSMTKAASVLIWTSIRVGSYEVFNLPILAEFLLIVICVRLSS